MPRLFFALVLLTFATLSLTASNHACGLAKAADPPTAADLLVKARAAFREGKRDEAIQLATKAIAIDKENVGAYVLRASMHDAMRQFDKAVADYGKVIKLEPDAASAYQQRGSAHFRAGHIKESIADFDVFLKHNPADEPHHWQRGLSYYYAGEFAKGVKQFEIHKTVNPQDVENAVWHYLCKARIDGIEKARAALIDIDSDRRPWAMPVYEMFQGKLKPDDLIKKMEAVEGNEARKKDTLYFTHLYIGLFYEADGKADLAKKHLEISVEKYGQPHYMGDVARVHLMLLKRGSDARHRIIYIVDASGSNLEAFPFMISEMRNSIYKLAEKQAFKVIVARHGTWVAWPFHGMENTNGEGRWAVGKWLDSHCPAPEGKRDLLPAIRYALSMESKLVFILSDGFGDRWPPEHAVSSLSDEVKKCNTRPVMINCLDFAVRGQGRGEPFQSSSMKKIAEDSGGLYKLITAAELAIVLPKQ